VDSFYVLDGVVSMRVGDETFEAGRGSYTAALPGTVHTFSNPGDEPVRVLNVMAPGGFEQYLKEVAASIPEGGAPDPAAMAQIAARHDFVPAV
jgi:mannose-6-phosphate isomerase-like protein (cupin superfamily)